MEHFKIQPANTIATKQDSFSLLTFSCPDFSKPSHHPDQDTKRHMGNTQSYPLSQQIQKLNKAPKKILDSLAHWFYSTCLFSPASLFPRRLSAVINKSHLLFSSLTPYILMHSKCKLTGFFYFHLELSHVPQCHEASTKELTQKVRPSLIQEKRKEVFSPMISPVSFLSGENLHPCSSVWHMPGTGNIKIQSSALQRFLKGL